MAEKMLTTYDVAAHWGNTALVLMNNIHELDPQFMEDNYELFQENEHGDYPEYYQYFVTNLSNAEAEYKKRVFGLKLGYSNRLDCWVLCVDHYGTLWRGVPCAVHDKSWWAINKKEYAYDKFN